MPTTVGILTFMSRINFMPSLVELEKSYITSGPDIFLSVKIAKTRNDTKNIGSNQNIKQVKSESPPKQLLLANSLHSAVILSSQRMYFPRGGGAL